MDEKEALGMGEISELRMQQENTLHLWMMMMLLRRTCWNF